MILDDIIKIQNGNNNSTLKLIEKFNPLLKKYAHSLYYEDAYCDLLVDFIELLNEIKGENLQSRDEGCLISYLTTSIHSSYIKNLIKLKRSHNQTIYSDLSENELYYIDTLTATNDTYINLEFDLLKKFLTYPEYLVIKMTFYEGYSVTETANFNGITRQAVNQMKNRALKKLKLLYMDKRSA